MRIPFAFVTLVAALSLLNLSCGNAGKGVNFNFSEDDAHKSFQAAAMSGDAALIRDVSKRLCISIPDGASPEDFNRFAEAHKSWVAKFSL